MKAKILFYAAVCLALLQPTALSAQDILPEYTKARRFAPSNAEQLLFSYTLTPRYFKNSVKFWYEYKTSAGNKWYVVDPETAKKQSLFDLDELAAQITETVKDPFTAQQLPIANLKLGDDDRTFTFEIASAAKTFYFSYDYITRRLTETEKDKSSTERWANASPNKTRVVYAKDLNLYCMSYADYERLQANPKDSLVTEIALTTDGVEDFAFGMPRNRMSTDSLYDHKRKAVQGCWSPDGRYFAATLVDQRAVGDLWVVNSVAKPRPTLETYKYQLPGEAGSPVVHLYLFDLDSQSRKAIKAECFKDQTLSLASKPRDNFTDPAVWLGNSNTFFLTRVSRDMKRVDICSYTLGEDSVKAIINERMNTYIETRPLSLTDNGTEELIHWSERDGWAHLYLYDTKGNLKNRITQGSWHVDKIEHVDSKARVVYFVANGKEKDDTTPYYEHLYRVNFDGTGLKLLTPGDYFHLTYMDKGGRFVVDNYSRVNTIPATALYNNQGVKLMTLEESDFSQLLLAGYRFPEPFKVKAADGVTDLYGLMYKPFDFDSTKVYPIIDYVYPGPQQEGTYFRYIPMNPRTDRLAQAGFIVISVGHRGGHPSRSKWYHNYGYGNLRDYPMTDHKAAIEQLCDRYTFMDINRVGIHGHSGGGFMSTAAMLLYPDFFKVAVSCAGNHDNNVYNRGWSEKHHGVKEVTDEEGNITFSIKVPANQELAKNLKGHLLLIHSEIDNNVHPANTILVVNELIKAGKRFDMLIIPNQRHHFENYNEYFYWRMVDYFSEHLLGKRETSIDIKDLKPGNWFQGYQE
ncbi:MAG: DPP IV N-terminal domain-containing protein [Tannerellaceae bacterium]|jgi:dipeptidyl aminopeptidase/acylaminoacyl peptidase|nr:DPP IV N-terminal domain-containing protein [Tannerellaceae bacterium]